MGLRVGTAYTARRHVTDMPATYPFRPVSYIVALVIVWIAVEAPAARAQEVEASRAAPGLLERAVLGHKPVVGLDAGARLDDPAGNRDFGPVLRLHVGRDLPGFPYLRGELGVGLSRLTSERRATLQTTEWSVPIALSLLGRGNITEEEVVPIPYLRAGAGLAFGWIQQDGVTATRQGSPSFTWRWGGGVELPIGSRLGMRRVLARVELTYGVDYVPPSKRGSLLLTFGIAYRHPADRDGDGVLDIDEACPAEPEDRDGFQDRDGCPDVDNDGDGLLDDDDGCPGVAEDRDGFEDQDGCPDTDNDADGVVDTEDYCPIEPEDADNWDDADGCPDIDNDEDGILDRRDVCPDEPEDIDGYADADGCPDPDNDGDLVADVDDACPFRPEAFNGFQDEDGCPDAPDDADGDGLVDAVDVCPTAPEDMDAFDDVDGCPDFDNDDDGVPDAGDACPMTAEDADRFDDDDGCPDLDNDRDGIADGADECPNEPEVINGHEDQDGCPDEGRGLVRLLRDEIEIQGEIVFGTDSDAILERSFALVSQVAALLKNHSEIEKVRIEAHTESRARSDNSLDLSQRRADSVARYLVEAGVEPERLVAMGFGATRPIASNRSRAGRDMNRRVELIVIERDE